MNMDILEGDDFNQNNYELYEEIMDESDADWKTTPDMEVHSKMSEVDIENLEIFDGSEAIAWNFQDLPDELILKVLSKVINVGSDTFGNPIFHEGLQN